MRCFDPMPSPWKHAASPHTGTAKQSGERSIQWEDVYPTKALINPCGDPPGDDRNLYGSFPTTNLDIADGTFPIKFVITTNHWGRIMYRLFTNPNDLNTDKHYVLERADGKGTAVHPPLEDGGNGDGMRALGTATSADWLGGWGQLYESQFRYVLCVCVVYVLSMLCMWCVTVVTVVPITPRTLPSQHHTPPILLQVACRCHL